MLKTISASHGMVVAPHHLASQTGLKVLRDGGNALEAMVAAAATISVVYPHMNSIGGDNFWLVFDGETIRGIDACGAAAAAADIDFYRDQGQEVIPPRGPLAANTVAGAISGWQSALELSAKWGGSLPITRLLEDAVYYADSGVPVTLSQHNKTREKLDELIHVPGFAETYLIDGSVPAAGDLHSNPALAQTLQQLGSAGLDDFYRGDLAKQIAAGLQKLGSPINADDLADHRAKYVIPLSVRLCSGTVYNMPPPTQGLASLMILGIFDRLGCAAAEDFQYIHGLIEATKRAFKVRDKYITDPAYMELDPAGFLTNDYLDKEAATIDTQQASPWPAPALPGDTVWLGAIDAQGRAVSFIQSVYWEFGSGISVGETGITWQNRGTSFSLNSNAVNVIAPRRKPFHTIQPAVARLSDGRVMIYGTMGGEGQPQTQAAIYTRYAMFDQDLQAAVTAPRWLLGRTWGDIKTNLRLENRFDPTVIEALKTAGHDVQVIGAFDEVMGHAGAIVREPTGVLRGAADPRGDGAVAS